MIWRNMNHADLETVFTIGNQIHRDYQEDRAVFDSRWQLYPEGCHVLDDQGTIQGYAITHPWRLYDAPKLNTVIAALPEQPDTYYIHDIALLPEARQGGYARQILGNLHTHAAKQGFHRASLVSVSGTRAFWEKQGYKMHHTPDLAALLSSYDDDAVYMIRNNN
jgi:GNAT superfamily N-acetyltransferase